jgi:hypothetical protein
MHRPVLVVLVVVVPVVPTIPLALVGRLTLVVVAVAVVLVTIPPMPPLEVVAVPALSSSVMQIHLEKRHPQQVPQQLPSLAVTAFTHSPDLGALLSNDIKTSRQNIRILCGNKVTNIGITTTTSELATYVTSPQYSSWTVDESNPVGITSIFDYTSMDAGTDVMMFS